MARLAIHYKRGYASKAILRSCVKLSREFGPEEVLAAIDALVRQDASPDPVRSPGPFLEAVLVSRRAQRSRPSDQELRAAASERQRRAILG